MSELFDCICDKVDSLELRRDIAKIYKANPKNEVIRDVLKVLVNIARNVNGTKELLERQQECNREYSELTEKIKGCERVIERLTNADHVIEEQAGSNEYLSKIYKLGKAIQVLGESGVDQDEDDEIEKLDTDEWDENPKENAFDTESSCELDSACKYERPRISKESLIPSILMYELDHLGEDDLQSVPNYMLGRLTLQQINSFIDQINTAICVKYTLLRKPKSALSYPEKRIISQYKAIKVPDLKGKTFISEENLIEVMGLKCLDKISLKFITILRHLKKLFLHNDKTVKYYYMS